MLSCLKRLKNGNATSDSYQVGVGDHSQDFDGGDKDNDQNDKSEEPEYVGISRFQARRNEEELELWLEEAKEGHQSAFISKIKYHKKVQDIDV